MKKRILSLALCALLLIGALPAGVFAADSSQDIVILFENDVHCAVEGYAKLSAMKKELQQEYAHVGVVSCGDYIQGGSLGTISQGEYIIQLMNLVGYDAVALGNHEFDYRLARLEELIGMMDTKPVCCNFRQINDHTPYFQPYSLVSYGDVTVAYIGITTPATLRKSSPAQFKDANGEYLYTFHPNDLCQVVQQTIDEAKAAGADYIIGLSHNGYAQGQEYEQNMDVVQLIAGTEGFDVVLDAHSHSVIPELTVTDRQGNDVLLSSTGTKFAYIGKLTISQGSFHTELISTEDYTNTDPIVDGRIAQIQEEYSQLGERKVAVSQVDLITHDEQGNRLIRNHETNMGDLCSDAFRTAVNAQIGYINGGGIRAQIDAGDVTFNDLLSILPYNNTIVLAEISGKTVLDLLEMAMMSWPEEGSFPHVTGMTFCLNTQLESSVVLDENDEFVGVDGPYRVYDVRIFNPETNRYEPMKPDQIYTIASHNYYLLEHGSGLKMLENTKVLQSDGMLDVEALERYIVEDLGGIIGEQYRQVTPNITFTDGQPGLNPGWIILAVVVCLGAAAAVVVLLRAKQKKKNAATAE